MASTTTENDIELWREIIAELCVSAPDTTIRDCLRLYNPVLPSKKIKPLLQKIKKDDILKTLIYLGPNQTISEKILKDNAIDMLIDRIKSLFPYICQICNEQYRIKREDEPFLCCEGCGQEVHRECYIEKLSEMNLIDNKGLPNLFFKSIPGFHYLCHICETNVIDSRISKMTLKVPTITTDQSEIVRDREQKSDRIDLNDEHDEQEKKNTLICKFYMKGNCQFGIKGRNCKYNHPKACKRLLQHGNKKPRGCNLGKKCQYFHPRMCANSIKFNKCLDQSCKYIHVKGTLRHEREERNKNPKNERLVCETADKEKDFLFLIQSLKTEIFQTIDKKFAEMNNSQAQPPRLMNQALSYTPWTSQPVFQHHTQTPQLRNC